MSDKRRTFLLDGSKTDEAAIEKLIRLGGQQEQIDPERRERVRRHVHQVWCLQQQALQLQSEVFNYRRWWVPATLAAGLCIAVVIFWGLNETFTPPGQRYAQPLAWIDSMDGEVLHGQSPAHLRMAIYADAHLETLSSSALSLQLSDGSLLKLDRSTHIKFLDQHQVQLVAGAVYYDSRNLGSILIHTPRGTVSDIGTRFETRLMRDDMVIRVRDGSVKLEQGTTSLVVDAGHALQLSASAADYSRIAPDDEQWIWADAIDETFSFDNRSMAEALYWVARKQGWELEYQTPSDQVRARKDILHGKISPQSADDLLQQLSLISDMRYQLSNNVLRVSYPEQSE